MNKNRLKSNGKLQNGGAPSLSNGLPRNGNKASKSYEDSVDFQSSFSHSINSNDQMQDLDLHLDLDDLEDNSDFSDDWDSESDKSDEELQNLAYNNTNKNHNELNGATGQSAPEDSTALVPYDDDGVDVDSEEERDIMKEIKNEITDKLRVEMKSELDMYKARVQALENGEIHGADADTANRAQEEDMEEMEPKLKAAILKMRKLDRILSKKIAREKQVKRDRILLERRIKQEIKELKVEGSKQNREETANTAKYLALTLPLRHNEGVEMPKNLAEPVFTTQLNEQDYPNVHKQSGDRNSTAKDNTGRTSNSQQDKNSEFGSETSSALGNSKSGKKRKKKKDFIKRNKELACEAENPVPMTDDEKHRLDGLLDDLESLPEIIDENFDPTASSESLSNAFQIMLKPGEGFQPEANEQRSLSHIDSRLRQLLPPEDYEVVASSSVGFTSQHKLFTPVGFRSGLDYERFGERALLETKEQRELQARLLQVEEELANLRSSHELELPETPQLGDDQLKDLLDQCVRSLSRSTYNESESGIETPSEATPRSPNSARESLMENPPKLPKATLQKLLADAYCPASRLSTLREEEEDNDDEDSDAEPIDVETWKLIAQERLEGEDDDAYQSHLNTVRSSLPPSYFSEQNSRNSSRNSSRNNYHKANASHDYSLSRGDSRESRTPFLPEINRSGSLVATQEWNNNRPSSIQSSRSSVITVHNSLDDNSTINLQDGTEVMSINGDTPVPMPPSGEKRSNSSYSNKSSRLTTPVHKTMS